jgi:hypothetical protein
MAAQGQPVRTVIRLGTRSKPAGRSSPNSRKKLLRIGRIDNLKARAKVKAEDEAEEPSTR